MDLTASRTGAGPVSVEHRPPQRGPEMDADFLAVVGNPDNRPWTMGSGVGRVSIARLVVDAAELQGAVATIALGGEVVAPVRLANAIMAVAARRDIPTISRFHHRHPGLEPCPYCDRLRGR